MLDAIQQRILGVLIEKERTVPDSYPMTENALQAGCNQKSNRDPEMFLAIEDVQQGLQSLLENAWVTRVEQLGGRQTVRWRHHFESQLGAGDRETAILTELLLRGAQAPGALKPRVARLGLTAEPPEILDVLQAMAAREHPLVDQQPRRPRERDNRWIHLLGPREEGSEVESLTGVTAAPPSPPRADTATAAPTPAPPPPPAAGEDRLSQLESEVASLRAELARLRSLVEGRDAQSTEL